MQPWVVRAPQTAGVDHHRRRALRILDASLERGLAAAAVAHGRRVVDVQDDLAADVERGEIDGEVRADAAARTRPGN